MATCSVDGCRSSQRLKENQNVKFHHFPKDKEVQEKWIELCNRKTPVNIKNARVCSLHFEPSAYKRQLMYELLNQPVPARRCVLRDDAVPTLNIPTLKGKRTFLSNKVLLLQCKG